MTDRPTYLVTAVWDGKWWVIGIGGLPVNCAGYTQAATEDEIDPTARECVALLLDVPEDSFDLDLNIVSKEN